MKNAIIFVIALAVSNLALAESHAQNYGKYAAPFGLEWGMSKEKLTAMGVKLTPIDETEGVYTAERLPKNLTDVKEYGLLFKQGFGLVKATAETNQFGHDWAGFKAKKRYSQLQRAIIKKYGLPDTVVEQTGINGTYTRMNQFYQCLMSVGCGAWGFVWGNKKDGYISLYILGVSDLVGVVSIGYESVAFYTAREQEAEERARAKKKEEEEIPPTRPIPRPNKKKEEERARADEDAL